MVFSLHQISAVIACAFRSKTVWRTLLNGVYMCCFGRNISFECPEDSSSPSGSTNTTWCTCNAGFQGRRGGPCVPCPAGEYCEGGGSAVQCPDHSHAPEGSNDQDDCSCKPSFVGPNGGVCEECSTGSFCAGGEAETPCPPHTFSLAGSSTQRRQGPPLRDAANKNGRTLATVKRGWRVGMMTSSIVV